VGICRWIVLNWSGDILVIPRTSERFCRTLRILLVWIRGSIKNVIVIRESSMKGGWKSVRKSLYTPLGFAQSYSGQISIMIS